MTDKPGNTGALADDTQSQLLDTVDRFIRKMVEPRAADIDEKDAFPSDLYNAAAAIGLCGIAIPSQYGGIDLDLRTQLFVTERLARSSPSFAVALSCTIGSVPPILVGGSEALKQEILPAIATGALKPCIAMSEASAGSDFAAITATGRREEMSYVLDGTKTWCTNGSVGDVFSVFVKTDPTAGHAGISAFLVRKEDVGFSVIRDEDLISLRGCPTTQIEFRDCRIPRERLLGSEGGGFKLAMSAMDEDRLNTAALALGIAYRCINDAIGYARERHAFGRPIIQHQGLQFLLAELATEFVTARAMWLQSIHELGKGRSRRVSTLCSISKNACCKIGMKAPIEAIQVFGAAGLSRSLPLERFMRDAKSLQIFDGTTQIHNTIIGRHLEREGIPI